MEQFIGCDAHKKFSLFVTMNERGEYGAAIRVSHEREAMREFLAGLPAGSKIALETSGSYYWLVDEMERAGHEPQLAHAFKAKRRMEGRHKTDQKDAQGLAMLLRNGTLPRVWIPPAELRDQREMLRLRMRLVRMRTQVKNRIHGTLTRYNVTVDASDMYGEKGRKQLAERLIELPPYSRQSVYMQLEMLDFLAMQIADCERTLEQILKPSLQRTLLRTLPGVGPILSAVMALEIGTLQRFASAEDLVSYAGLVPAAHQSAERRGRSQCPKDCNNYLRWAYVEAANVVACNQVAWRQTHVVKLYQRVRRSSKLHAKAVVAVGHQLAEASFWMLRKEQVYRAPGSTRPAASSTLG